MALAPATAAGRTLWAKNSDRPPDEPQQLEWIPPRRDTGRVRTTWIEVDPAPGETIGVLGSRPSWMWGLEHGVNEAGVAAGNETIFTTDDPRRAAPALVGMDLVRLALERSTTAGEARDEILGLLDRYGQGGSGHRDKDRPYWSSFLVADADGGVVIETSGRDAAVEQVDRVRAISNRTTIPAFDAERRHPGQPVETLVDPRWRASQAVLAAEPVTVDGVKEHLRSHVGQEGFTVCMHVPDVEATTASAIALLGRGQRPEGRFLMGSPCTSVYVPLFVGRPLGDPPPWQAFALLRPEHRAVLDELEAGLDADAADEDGWGPEAWRRVAETLASFA